MHGRMSNNYHMSLMFGNETLNLGPCKLAHTIASELQTLACSRAYIVQMLQACPSAEIHPAT